MTKGETIKALRAECEAIFPGGTPFKHDDQEAKVAAAIANLQARSSRLDQLRIWQAANVDMGEPRARQRAGVKLVWAEVQKRAPTLASADAAGWARLAARVALMEPNALAAFREAPPRDASEAPSTLVSSRPTPVPEKSKDAYIVANAKTPLEAVPLPPAGHVSYHNRAGANIELDLSVLNTTITNCLVPAIRATAVRAETGLHRLEAVTNILIEDRNAHHQALATLARLVHAPGAHWELDLLWWSQALYSRSARRPYRDIVDEAPRTLLPAMATDLIAAAGAATHDPPVLALFVETARKLLPNIDARRPEGEWLSELLEAGSMAADFDEIVRADDTLLPVSGYLVAIDPVAVAKERMTVRTGRWVVREYLRERMNAAWLTEGA